MAIPLLGIGTDVPEVGAGGATLTALLLAGIGDGSAWVTVTRAESVSRFSRSNSERISLAP